VKQLRATRILPGWVRGYDRTGLRTDVIAGVVVWSVVTPQAVAYAQIAGLSPAAGLVATPVAMIAYALLGSSRQLVVSATTATAAVSAATVGPLAHGDATRFAALSAALALIAGIVFLLGGLLRLGAIADLISKPVMTGFLFGLGLTIALEQVPSILGVDGGAGNFFPRLWDLIGQLGEVDGATLVVGAASIAVLVAGRALLPAIPATLVVLALGIGVSALLGFDQHGIATVGHIPDALPDPAIPDVGADDLVSLIAPAFGVLVLSAEGIGVARALAVKHGYPVDTNRDLVAMGAGNVLTGLSSGFVQAGGASQTAAADAAGGRSQLVNVLAGGLVLLTGAFLAPVFEDLPEATLGAIVVVAVFGFLDVGEIRRFLRVRHSAVVFALLALVGVLVLGILQGLIVTAGLSLVYLVMRLSRPGVGLLGRDPATGRWGHLDGHPGWIAPPMRDAMVVRCDGPLAYPNVVSVKERVLALAAGPDPAPRVLVLDLSVSTELDVQSADVIAELAAQLGARGTRLRLAEVRRPAAAILLRAGVAPPIPIAPSIDLALVTDTPEQE
jgi:high affinity sulfate transporter 1